MIARSVAALLGLLQDNRVDVWKGCGGVIQSGEMLLVLGSPGSGCTTFLNAIAGETYGMSIGNESKLNYHGRSTSQLPCVTCSNECARIQSEEYTLHLPRLCFKCFISYCFSRKVAKVSTLVRLGKEAAQSSATLRGTEHASATHRRIQQSG